MGALNASPPMSTYRKRFISCSGTYYIDGSKPSSKWCWSFILLFLILLICVVVFVGCLIATMRSGPSVIEEFHKHCKNETSVTNEQLLSYERYFNSFPNKGLNKICRSVTCFIRNNATVTRVNTLNPDARVLGETVFSDWCFEDRERYPGKLLASPERIPLETTSAPITLYVQEYEKFVHLVGYNESANLSDKLVSGLLQWRHYFETGDDEVFFGTPEYKRAMNESKLYELLRDSGVDADGIHKAYLMKNRVFATELYLPEYVYFYNSPSNGIITDKVCPKWGQQVKVYVIVLGFDRSHWIVQAVGQKWKQASPDGIMRLADSCYKNNDYSRLFDLKLPNPGVPVGSLTDVPLVV